MGEKEEKLERAKPENIIEEIEKKVEGPIFDAHKKIHEMRQKAKERKWRVDQAVKNGDMDHSMEEKARDILEDINEDLDSLELRIDSLGWDKEGVRNVFEEDFPEIEKRVEMNLKEIDNFVEGKTKLNNLVQQCEDEMKLVEEKKQTYEQNIQRMEERIEALKEEIDEETQWIHDHPNADLEEIAPHAAKRRKREEMLTDLQNKVHKFEQKIATLEVRADQAKVLKTQVEGDVENLKQGTQHLEGLTPDEIEEIKQGPLRWISQTNEEIGEALEDTLDVYGQEDSDYTQKMTERDVNEILDMQVASYRSRLEQKGLNPEEINKKVEDFREEKKEEMSESELVENRVSS